MIKKRRTVPAFCWSAVKSYESARMKGHRVLLLVVRPARDGRWGAIGAEASADVSSAEETFADHAHHVIGEFDSVIEAQTACERFARKWKPSAATACDCKEIKT